MKIIANGITLVQVWREYLHLTQAEVAEKMDITPAAYSQIETAKKTAR